jgi:hypothetical protein
LAAVFIAREKVAVKLSLFSADLGLHFIKFEVALRTLFGLLERDHPFFLWIKAKLLVLLSV